MEVLQISRSYDLETGKPAYEISFGKSFPVNEKVRRRLKSAEDGEPPEEVSVNVVTLVILQDGPLPYKAGSRWVLTVSDNGDFRVTTKGKTSG